ncbi:unnamed protein product [Chrysodeixis includens]|uniref:DET1- and DDB1-associated protein 1 domain-containing protein n=1 Tax=Chrysodeixis includens TaxID=689277 RepID=A0A9N8KUG2_CHRIL|nr:unnamed protein product [Chrysodeixis includens]
MSVMEFLKDLPSYDEHNFTLFNTDHGIRNCSKRPSIYLPTKDIPSEQKQQFTEKARPEPYRTEWRRQSTSQEALYQLTAQLKIC